MANIGATTAFYKVETSLTRANSEVSKSMERLATGKANANAGDRSSYVAMADTFRLDFVGTKAGVKGASVTMGYLETGMRVLDSASALLSRLQELAVLGANGTNTVADGEAINLEAEAIADEFNRLMTTSTYKGRDVFNDTAGSLYVSMGGRDQEMTFGIGRITYTDLYNNAAERTIQNAITNDAIHTAATVAGPNQGAKFNLAHLPSDAVTAKDLGKRVAQLDHTADMARNTTYVMTAIHSTANENEYHTGGKQGNDIRIVAGVETYRKTDTTNTQFTGNGSMEVGDVVVVGGTKVDKAVLLEIGFRQVLTGDHAFKAGDSYVITSLGNSNGAVADDMTDAGLIARAVSGINVGDTLVVGQRFR